MPRRTSIVVVPENTQQHALARRLDVLEATPETRGNGSNDPLELMLASMKRCGSRRKPSSFLQDAFNSCKGRAEMEECMRDVFELGDTGRSPTSGWACKGCKQPDRSKLVPSQDKSGWVCSLCGACDGHSNFQETEYEASTRTVRIRDDAFAKSLTASEFADSKARKKARVANEATGMSFPGSMRSAQERTTRKAVSESAISQTLTERDRKRMEKAMLHLHSVFRLSGLDPDSNPICRSAFDVASHVFTKAALHMQVCSNRNRTCAGNESPTDRFTRGPSSPDCSCLCDHVVSMVRHADSKLIGKACIAHVLKRANDAATSGNAFESVGPTEIKDMSRKLAGEMAAYNKAVGVAREAEATIVRITGSSQSTLCVACDDNDAELDAGEGGKEGAQGIETASGAFPLAISSHGDDEDQHSQCVEAFLERLSVSLLSAKTIGWIDERVLGIAQKHVVSVACYDWVCDVRTWSADVVAGIVCVKTLSAMKFSTGQTVHTLKKLAKKHKITMQTVQSAMDSMPTPCG